MYEKIKRYLKKKFPEYFIKIRAFKDQIFIEFRTVRQIGLLRILSRLLSPAAKWRTELPLQSIKRVKIDINSLEELCEKFSQYKEGGHTIYFPRLKDMRDYLKEIFTFLPDNVGLKVLKRTGGKEAPYASIDKTCNMQTLLAPSHGELNLVHGIFYNLGLGPRLYDLIEIEFSNGRVHTAYCVEHIGGTVPSQNECEKYIERLKQLEADKIFKLINWNGFNDGDFTCPGCNGNLLSENESCALKYVDLQNFSLGDYSSYLKNIALEASKASHFGQKSYIMGGDYLYQEIPGLNALGKRSPSDRFEAFSKLLATANLTVDDKLVLDVGCNLGLMGAQYLKAGASWVHGFDMPQVVPLAEKVLLSVGCTRFSTTGIILSDNVSLINTLPNQLKEQLTGCVISYLAIRGHIGWIQELGNIPWEFMLYEGHEMEDKTANQNFLSELKKITECSIVAEGYVSDANSAPRYIALVKSLRQTG